MNTPTPRALYLLFGTCCNNEHYNGDADYILVTIDLAYAKKLMERIAWVKKIKKVDPNVHRLVIFDAYVDYFSAVEDSFKDGRGELIELPGCGEHVILDTAPTIPDDRYVRMECHAVHVSDTDVYWDAIVKHSTVTIEAYCLEVKELKHIIKRLEAAQRKPEASRQRRTHDPDTSDRG